MVGLLGRQTKFLTPDHLIAQLKVISGAKTSQILPGQRTAQSAVLMSVLMYT